MRLIVNADDFGLSPAVSEGIVKAHREGIVTSTTMMACGEAAADAAAMARECPSLGVGVHLCLTRERPICDPSDIPTITRDGRLLDGPLQLMSRLVSGRVERSEIEAELRAQIQKVISLGIRPTHIDGHQHLHVMPFVFPITLGLAKEYSINALRYPVGPWYGKMGYVSAAEKSMLELISLGQKKLLIGAGLKTPDHFLGLPQTGKLGKRSLLELLKYLPEGTSEIMCHPGMPDDEAVERTGWGKGWEMELAALTDERIKAYINERGIELISYGGL